MSSTRTLNVGTILNNKYCIDSILGEGGFGITYLATDMNIGEKVAIKEYFPAAFGTRDTIDGQTKSITAISDSNIDYYEKGLERFEKEASNLAKFIKEPGIMSVKNYFKENNTGYMVMEFLDGITLKEYLRRNGGKMPYEEVLRMMVPLMESLSNIHRYGIIHRDISPDNIMVCNDGKIKLIDFGAARFIGYQDERSLSVLLKPGYSPIEQYNKNGKQGPWTDVYALCATMYRLISGNMPTESVARVAGTEKLEPIIDIPKEMWKAIEKGLEIKPEKRFQSVDELRVALTRKRKRLPSILSGVVLTAALVCVTFFAYFEKKQGSPYAMETTVSEETVILSENGNDVELVADEEKNCALSEQEDLATDQEEQVWIGEVDNTDSICETRKEKYVVTGRVKPRDITNTQYLYSSLTDLFILHEGDEVDVFVDETVLDGFYIVSCSDIEVYAKDEKENKLIPYAEDKIKIPTDKLRKKASDDLCEMYYEQVCTVKNVDREYADYLYEDFDGDGVEELFVIYAVSSNAVKFFYTAGGDIWEGTQRLNGGYLRSKYVKLDAVQFGATIIAHATINESTNSNVVTEFAFVIENEKPKKLDWKQIENKTGWFSYLDYSKEKNSRGILRRYDVKAFDSEGNTIYLESIVTDNTIIYPIIYYRGELEEYESEVISEEDFLKWNGAKETLNRIDEYSKREHFFESALSSARFLFKISEYEIDSILYNDKGYFVINLILDTEICPYARNYDNSNAITGGIELSKNFLDAPSINELEYGTFSPKIKFHDENNKSVMTNIDKLMAHMYVKINWDERWDYDLEQIMLGEVSASSGKFKTGMTSDYNLFLQAQ